VSGQELGGVLECGQGQGGGHLHGGTSLKGYEKRELPALVFKGFQALFI